MKVIASYALALALAFGASSCSSAQKSESKNQPEVKNLIYIIGDGMGLAHATMLMVEGGYQPTVFDQAENIALQKTYSLNNRVTDSAAAGTALSTGSKTNNKMISMAPDSTSLKSIMTTASENGKATGVVVTSVVQHATPAVFYASTDSRYNYDKISEQLAQSSLDVVIGGGAKYLRDESYETTPESIMRSRGYQVVEDMTALKSIEKGKVLGIFSDKDLPAAGERGNYLPEATAEALKILNNDSTDGFMLMVEGSQIDWAAHANDAEWLLKEMKDFNATVETAIEFAKQTPGTLVVVTADHETGGLSITSNNTDFTLSDSGVNYNFGTKGHSGSLVPVYLYGAGAESINGIMENCDLANRLIDLMVTE